ncbi:MAG: hypothetical protein J5I93_12260 [Pirellulaceae bacterium]|nr:hypothetical protein [Pirellulaceae bacterium]
MAVWAYACRPCRGERPEVIWYVAASDCEKLAADTTVVRVQVRDGWRCAIIDRARRVEVEGLLVRQVIDTDCRSCDDCQDN